MAHIDDGDLFDFVFKPLYMVVDVLREFLFLLYILLGLLFLFYLAEKEFPGFKLFIESLSSVTPIAT